MKARITIPVALAVFTGLLLVGCQQTDSPDTADADQGDPSEVMESHTTMMGPDTTGASVWAHITESDYSNAWTLWPEKGELYTGQQPHGALLTTYLNDIALSALESDAGTMPEGAVIVKENYMPNSELAAVTVMVKVKGYNPSEGDWFYSKHLPDGSLDQMNGMGLAGRVPGCIGCHRAQASNDFVFTSNLSE